MVLEQLPLTTFSGTHPAKLNPAAGSVLLSESLGDRVDPLTLGVRAAATGNVQTEIPLPGTIPSNRIQTLTSDGTEIQSSINGGSIFYVFNGSGNINFALVGLSQDIDLQLLDGSGIEIARSTNPGTTNESINLINAPEDSYIVRVYDPDNTPSQTNFTLRASNNGISNIAARENNDIPNLNNNLSFSGRVGTQDASDIFRFNLPSSGSIQVNLAPLTPLAYNNSTQNELGVRVIRQIDGGGRRDGFFEGDEILATDFAEITNNGGNITITNGTLTLSNLQSGNYFVQVFHTDSTLGATRYNLNISRLSSAPTQPADPVTEPVPLATGGGLQTEISLPTTIPNSRNLTLDGSLNDEIQSSINGGSVFYVFNGSGNINLGLVNLSQDIDLQLLDGSGIEVARSTNPGTTNESINLIDLPQDSYIIRVYDPDNTPSQTNFTLRASNNSISDVIARENNNIPNLNSSLSFSGGVSNQDASDIFRINLPNPSTIQIDLTLLRNNFFVTDSTILNEVGVRIIRQIDGNDHRDGFIEGDEILGSTSASIAIDGSNITITNGTLTLSNLQSGNYFVQVFHDPNGNQDLGAERYRLDITRPNPAPDLPISTLVDPFLFLNNSRTAIDLI